MNFDDLHDSGKSNRHIKIEHVVLVPKPMLLSEAGFLQDALKRHGINAQIRESRSNHARHEPAYVIVVEKRDIEAALSVIQNILSEEMPDKKSRRSRSWKKSFLIRTIIAGILGFVGALRVGKTIRNVGVWLIPFAAMFALIAMLVSWLGFREK